MIHEPITLETGTRFKDPLASFSKEPKHTGTRDGIGGGGLMQIITNNFMACFLQFSNYIFVEQLSISYYS